MSFYAAFGTPVSVIRPFNTYGPRQSARAVIPTIITQIAAGERSIKLGALHPTRDFNFVSDTVSGFIAVGQSEGSVGEVINIGSGFEISIGDLVNLIGEAMGAELQVSEDSKRLRPAKSEVERLLAGNAKALDLLDWKPELGSIDGLRKGISITSEWFQNPDNLSRYKADRYNI
jgi:dTDP-glucose 4,6-dehydratase